MKIFVLKNTLFLLINVVISSFFCISLLNIFSSKDYTPFLKNNLVLDYLRYIGICRSIHSYKLVYEYKNDKSIPESSFHLKISDNTYILYETEYKGLIWGSNFYSPNTNGKPTMATIFNKILNTLKLSIPGIISSYFVAILFIVFWTLCIRGKVLNNIFDYIMILLHSLPRNLLVILIVALASLLNVNIKNPILGGFAWFFSFFIFNSVIFKQSLDKVLSEDYIKVAKSRGISKFSIITRHAMLPSLIPLITNMRGVIVTAFFGASIIETMFGINGIGTLTVAALKTNDAILYRDMLFIGVFIYLIPNLITDIATYSINPYKEILE